MWDRETKGQSENFLRFSQGYRLIDHSISRYTGPMPRTVFSGTCIGCGNTFSVPIKSSKRPAPKYCSRDCFKAHGIASMRQRGHAALAVRWGAVEGHKKPRTKACETCGEIIDCKPCRKRRFCSKACWINRPVSGYAPVAPSACRKCGVTISKSPSSNRQFCSVACFRLWKTENPSYYREPRTTRCKNCGSLINAPDSRKRQFCNISCCDAYRRASSIPKADGTVVQTQRRTLKWQRKYAREIYGNKCCRCGYNRIPGVLQVHHKDFNPRNQERDNVLLLCPTCHEEEHFLTKTGRFGPHIRNQKKPYEQTYKFKKNASTGRMDAVEAGLPDPGPRP